MGTRAPHAPWKPLLAIAVSVVAGATALCLWLARRPLPSRIHVGAGDGVLLGRAVDAVTGLPLARIRFRLWANQDLGIPERRFESAADGSVCAAGLPVGAAIALDYGPEGALPVRAPLILETAGERAVDFPVEPYVGLSGRVFDAATGHGIGGATIALRRAMAPGPLGDLASEVELASDSFDGAFAVSVPAADLAAGRVSARIGAEGYRSLRVDALAEPSVAVPLPRPCIAELEAIGCRPGETPSYWVVLSRAGEHQTGAAAGLPDWVLPDFVPGSTQDGTSRRELFPGIEYELRVTLYSPPELRILEQAVRAGAAGATIRVAADFDAAAGTAAIAGEARYDGLAAPLRIRWQAGRLAGMTEAGADGHYRIDGLPAGKVTLTALRLPPPEPPLAPSAGRIKRRYGGFSEGNLPQVCAEVGGLPDSTVSLDFDVPPKVR